MQVIYNSLSSKNLANKENHRRAISYIMSEACDEESRHVISGGKSRQVNRIRVVGPVSRRLERFYVGVVMSVSDQTRGTHVDKATAPGRTELHRLLVTAGLRADLLGQSLLCRNPSKWKLKSGLRLFTPVPIF